MARYNDPATGKTIVADSVKSAKAKLLTKDKATEPKKKKKE